MASSTDIRHQRQHEILHDDMDVADVLVVGAGMVGGWATLALARAVRSVEVWDDDLVGSENLGCQPYVDLHAGTEKVYALQEIGTALPIRPAVGRFTARSSPGAMPSVVVSAVDSMSGRKMLAEWAQRYEVPIFLDARILGELVAIAVADPTTYPYYLAQLPGDDEVPDAPCGAQGTAFSGMFAASRIVADLNAWMHGIPIPLMRVWHVGLMDLVQRGEEVLRRDVPTT